MKIFIIIIFLFQSFIIGNNNNDIQKYVYIPQCSYANRIKNFLNLNDLNLKTKIINSKEIKVKIKEIEIKCEKNRQIKKINNN